MLGQCSTTDLLPPPPCVRVRVRVKEMHMWLWICGGHTRVQMCNI